MQSKPKKAAALAVLLALAGGSSLLPTTAHARAECLYKGFSPFKNKFINTVEGHATAAKKSWACNRARNKCLDKLRYDWKIGINKDVRCQRMH